MGSYSTYSTFMEFMNGLGFVTDATTGNPVPNSMYNVSSVSINEAFSPLLGVDMTFHNNLTAKLEYRTTRVLNLSMTSVQLNEATSHDTRVDSAKDTKSQATGSQSARGGLNNDLNLRLDISYRKQANISRDIATVCSFASSGNTAFKLSFMADYTLSRLLTMSFYYDSQTNTPLLTSSSYPTTTHDFGLSLKFSLTR